MKITILHPSLGRPEQALSACNHTITQAHNPHFIEYIFACESTDKDAQTYLRLNPDVCGVKPLTTWTCRESCVAAVNHAARFATGDLFVCVADDLELSPGWDSTLIWAIGRAGKHLTRDPFVVWVGDGINRSGTPTQPDLITIAICNRAYYDLQGGFILWPEYESLWADNDWTECARRRGVIIDARDVLTFKHWHRSVEGGFADDATYRHTSSRARFEQGRRVFGRRVADGFSNAVPFRAQNKS